MSGLRASTLTVAILLCAACSDSAQDHGGVDPSTSTAEASASAGGLAVLVDDPDLELPTGFVLTDSLENTSDDTYATDLQNPEVGEQPWGEGTWREAKVFPDGERLLVFPYHTGPLLVDREGAAIIELSEGRLNCPTITRSGDEVLYIPSEGEPGERLLHRIDLTTPNESGGFVITIGGHLFPPDTDCPVEVGGLFEYDADTGEIRHVIPGLVGAPAYSPDGDWIVFSYNSTGADDAWEYWIATSDGRSARRLGEDRYFPAFVPG